MMARKAPEARLIGSEEEEEEENSNARKLIIIFVLVSEVQLHTALPAVAPQVEIFNSGAEDVTGDGRSSGASSSVDILTIKQTPTAEGWTESAEAARIRRILFKTEFRPQRRNKSRTIERRRL